jgi:8-oxo-dGTP diphosphatase
MGWGDSVKNIKFEYMKTIKVVAAIIIDKGKVLCVQRGNHDNEEIAFKFEFPGGKIESNESKEAALIREIKEELTLNIQPISEYANIEYQYSTFKLAMYCYICKCNSQSLNLTEHIDFKWLSTNELLSLNWVSADLPVVKKLMRDKNLF